MPDTIQEAYPGLVSAGEPVIFRCPSCGIWNGSTIHSEDGVGVVVCGACWAKHNAASVEEIERGPNS